jgi:hypothetical protein
MLSEDKNPVRTRKGEEMHRVGFSWQLFDMIEEGISQSSTLFE